MMRGPSRQCARAGPVCLLWALPAAVQVERSRLDVPSARPSSAALALPAEDGRLWPGGKRAGWNRGHDLAAGENLRAVARALRCGLATVQRARAAA